MARPKPVRGYLFFPEIREEKNASAEYEWYVFSVNQATANSGWLLSPKGRKAAMVSGVAFTARHAMIMAMTAVEALTAAKNGTLSKVSDKRLAEYIIALERSQGKAVALWGDCLAEQRRRQRTVFTAHEDSWASHNSTTCIYEDAWSSQSSSKRDCSLD